MNEDLACIAEILSGQQSQFRILLSRYEHKVYGFVYKLVQDPHLAEDVTQETFLAVYRNLKSYDPSKPFSPWLFSIAKYAAYKVIKGRAKVDLLSDDSFSQLTSEKDAIEPQIIAKEEAEQVIAALESLSQQQMDVLTLKYFEDLDHQMISNRLGIPKKKIENIIYAAKQKLKIMLQDPTEGSLYYGKSNE